MTHSLWSNTRIGADQLIDSFAFMLLTTETGPVIDRISTNPSVNLPLLSSPTDEQDHKTIGMFKSPSHVTLWMG